MDIYPTQTAANARLFLRDLARAATGQHEFDQLCTDLGIEHWLTPPMRPQTNGMVERFKCRSADVLQSHRFQNGEDLEQTILRYVTPYNQQLPQSALAEKVSSIRKLTLRRAEG